MTRSRIPRALAFTACALLCLAAGPSAVQGKTLTVTKKETRLRKDKRAFAPAVTDLREGDRLALNRQDGAWYHANYRDQAGWIHQSDVSTNKDVRLSGQGVREQYTASEAEAARKGFNPEVERQYRADNPALAAAYQKVDAIQAKVAKEEDVARFLREGKLLEETP
jgi:hypothetical protein